MEKGESTKEELYKEAEGFHTSLDRRLRMLLRKPFLSEDEEVELKMVKKKVNLQKEKVSLLNLHLETLGLH